MNATGPWVDHVRALLPRFDGAKTVRLTKGTHVILPAVSPDHALFAAIRPGERVFLMLPWHGHALLGTTDTDFDGDPASVQPDQADIEYLLAAVNRVLRQPLAARDVLGSFAGLRALAIEPGRSPSANTREYRFHEESEVKNFVTICGGKLTTARALGEKLVDRIASQLGVSIASAQASRTTSLPGGNTGPFEDFVRRATETAKNFGVAAPTAERIIRTYGGRWIEVLGPIRRKPRACRAGRREPTAAQGRGPVRHPARNGNERGGLYGAALRFELARGVHAARVGPRRGGYFRA